MNIALIGFGRMGHEIQAAALSRGHKVKLIIDAENSDDLNSENMKEIDAAIEFSMPESAFTNVVKCLRLGVPVVSGTTGWLDKYDQAAKICIDNNTSFIYSSNFSIGVNLLFKLNSELAKYMNDYPDYSVSIEEIHHTKKLDAPSGTAISLANGITENHAGYTDWTLIPDTAVQKVPVTAIREGVVPGTHTVAWDSEIDTLFLKHVAKSRRGFAVGAVVAAEYIKDRKGVFTMKDVMGL